jgi:hypothetical protein
MKNKVQEEIYDASHRRTMIQYLKSDYNNKSL